MMAWPFPNSIPRPLILRRGFRILCPMRLRSFITSLVMESSKITCCPAMWRNRGASRVCWLHTIFTTRKIHRIVFRYLSNGECKCYVKKKSLKMDVHILLCPHITLAIDCSGCRSANLNTNLSYKIRDRF